MTLANAAWLCFSLGVGLEFGLWAVRRVGWPRGAVFRVNAMLPMWIARAMADSGAGQGIRARLELARP